MDRMGGAAGMESEGIHGSKFWIELPGVGVSAV
jgi:signal transduction histidine kinase